MREATRIPWHRRLYTRIYLSVLGIVAVLLALWSLAEMSHDDPNEYGQTQRTLMAVAMEALPEAMPEAQLQASLARWSARSGTDLALYGADGRVRAVAGTEPWASHVPPLARARMGAAPPDTPLPLGDGRWLLVHQPEVAEPEHHRLVLFATIVALAMALGCYAIARRLTRRLEQLQRGVATWGTGAWSERVQVQGRDEVAELARSFNGSAQRIESLVRAQKALLSNASHELRSPLARLRMAIELLPGTTPETLRIELARNIAELDQLVGEILLASRLEAQGDATVLAVDLDLAVLAAEECAATGATLQAAPAPMRGDPVLLRRLLRNLLENARRHGGGRAVSVRIAVGPAIELTVCDEGPGIPEAQRERVFEPFFRMAGASEEDGGVGLGLALVRQIARAHGGDASCVAPAASGACFLVRLPPRPDVVGAAPAVTPAC
jgi:signal transduction histidine kinase